MVVKKRLAQSPTEERRRRHHDSTLPLHHHSEHGVGGRRRAMPLHLRDIDEDYPSAAASSSSSSSGKPLERSGSGSSTSTSLSSSVHSSNSMIWSQHNKSSACSSPTSLTTSSSSHSQPYFDDGNDPTLQLPVSPAQERWVRQQRPLSPSYGDDTDDVEDFGGEGEEGNGGDDDYDYMVGDDDQQLLLPSQQQLLYRNSSGSSSSACSSASSSNSTTIDVIQRRRSSASSSSSSSSSTYQYNQQPYQCGPSSSSTSSTPWFVLVAFALVGVFAMHTMRSSVIDAAEQVSILRENKDRMADQFSRTEQRLLKLKRQVSAIDAMAEGGGGNAHQQEAASQQASSSQRMLREVTDLKQRLKSEKEQVLHLKEQVQAAGKLQVMEKYGNKKHRVEIELVFPDRSQLGPHRFVIELAPIDMMPHSVHTFLEMVSNGLLDGCSFILNALHVVKAAPLPYDGSSAANKAKAFTAHGLESVSFKEYNEKYPHKQYTVGFAADGSPSFYINTQDNSEIHAGDPCFGKIVDGIDAIKRLETQPTRNGIWFQKRIGIKSARLLKD